MITKRKNNDNHYDNDVPNDDEQENDYLTDRIKSKRVRNYYIETKEKIEIPEICINCGYGKMDNKCRCTINIYDVNIDKYIMKFCNFCENNLQECECPISLWSIFQCTVCKISHSIFDTCTQNINCQLCDKNLFLTSLPGCRCMHGDIKYILSDIDIKSMYHTSDYVKTLDKKEYQPSCIHCSNHLLLCKCYDTIMSYTSNDETQNDETQNDNNLSSYESYHDIFNTDDTFDDDVYCGDDNDVQMKKDMYEQMYCD